MALQWTSALRDRVTQLVLGVVYSSCRADEKTFIDNNDSSAAPTSTPAGIAGERLSVVNQYAQWFDESGITTGGGISVWDHVLVRECAAHVAVAFRPTQAKDHFAALDDAWQAAIDTYSTATLDPATTTVLDSSITLAMLRFHVIRNVLRRGTGKRRLFIPIKDVDFAAQSALNLLWSRCEWEFRTRQIQITLPSATPTVPTFDLPSSPAQEVFDSLTTRWLTYDDSTNSLPVSRVIQLTQTEFADQQASFGTTTGTPQYFYIENRGAATRYWRWLPLPDQDYTLRGACTIMPPTFSSTTDTLPTTRLPQKLRPLLPSLTLAYALRKYGADPDGTVWKTAMDELDVLAPAFDDPGSAASENMSPSDVYMDYSWSSRFGGGGI